MDIEAVLCGAVRMGDGLSPYTSEPVCAGMRPAAYVYAPQVAGLFVAPIQMFGAAMIRDIYVWAVLVPATLFLVWFALLRTMPRLGLHYRLLAFSSLSAMTFVCANIGIVMHAAILASLLISPRKKWLFTAAVLLCAYIKPTFLIYLVVFLLEDRPLHARCIAFVWRAVAGIGVVGFMFATAGQYGDEWRALLRTVALVEQPGLGWFALTDWAGIKASSIISGVLALGFMAAMLASGMVIARWGKLTFDERMVLGLGLAPLMTPRLMDYDMVLIVPYAVLLMAIALQMPGRIFRFNVTWIFIGAMVLGILADMFHVKAYHRTHTAMFIFSALTLVIGFRLALSQATQIENQVRRVFKMAPLRSGEMAIGS